MFNQYLQADESNYFNQLYSTHVSSLQGVTVLLLTKEITVKENLEELLETQELQSSMLFCTDRTHDIEKYLSGNLIDILIIDYYFKDLSVFKQNVEYIRQNTQNAYIPIIYIDKQQSSYKIADLLAIVDDVHYSTINIDIIPKIYNGIRFAKLFNNSKIQTQSLHSYKKQHNNDLIVAKRLFENLSIPEKLSDPRLISHQKSESLFNGNFVLTARSLSGDLCVFLGAFSGIGLTAAIGAMTISGIFTTMVSKGFSLTHILTEINKKLLQILPKKIYCNAACAYIDERNGLIHFFNSGIKNIFIQRQKHEPITINADKLPLGIDSHRNFHEEINIYNVDVGDNIILLNDSDKSNQENITRLFNKEFSSHVEFENLNLKIHKTYKSSGRQIDSNIIYVASKVDSVEKQFEEKTKYVYNTDRAILDWQLQFKLGPESLKTFDPLPLLLHIIVENPELKVHRSEIYTVLAELYSNSLEHGVLRLSSDLKQEENGFEKYYAQRLYKLENLQDGFVKFKISNQFKSNTRKLILSIEDSGIGFDTSVIQIPTEQQYSGRGLPLLYSICEQVKYNSVGNKVTAVYKW